MALISNGTTILDAGSVASSFKGSMTLIKKLTASSDATLSFVNGASGVVLDGTYKEYVFMFNNMHPGTDNTHFVFNMSIDTGSNYNVTKTTTYFHAAHNESGSASEVEYQTPSDLAQSTDFTRLQNFSNSNSDASCTGTLHLYDPSNTTHVKHFISIFNSSSYTTDPYTLQPFTSGYGNTTSAVDAVQFKYSSGNIDAGDICLYGIS